METTWTIILYMLILENLNKGAFITHKKIRS